MTLTAEEKEVRRNYVTATDVPKILNVDPWSNEADAFHFKSQGLEIPENEAMEAGNFLEPGVLAWANKQLGGIRPGGFVVHPNGINAATLDAVAIDLDPIEAKTSGIVGPGNPAEWGAEGTDEIPEHYLLQVQAQLFVTGRKHAYVPALIGGRGFVMFEVEFNAKIALWIEQASASFIQRLRENRPPTSIVPSLETLKKLRRTPGKVVPVPDEIAVECFVATEDHKRAKDRMESAKAAVIHALGDGDGASWKGGTFTYFEQTRRAHEVRESTFRVLRHQDSKSVDNLTIVLHSRRMIEVDNRLTSLGYYLKDQSPSGSRYYVALGKPQIRVSDHDANAATAAWMQRDGVMEIRVDDEQFASRLLTVSQ